MTTPRPRRIALIEPAGRGGICHYTRGLSTALARRGLDVTLFTAREYEFAALDLPFRVERIFARARTSPLALLRKLRELQPDLLHLQSGTHPALHLALAVAAKRATGAPLVITAHDVVPKNATRLDAWFCRALYRAADRIVVLGEALAREIVDRFPATRGRVSVVPHGEYGFLVPAAATSAARAAPRDDARRSRARADAAPPTLLFFGYLHEEKGLPDLIDALPSVAHELPDLRVVIAGKPELDVAALRARAALLGVGSRIDWRPHWIADTEVAELFRQATAVVLPYRKASQSGVAFLAGAYARPLIATRVGALPEIVEEGRGGTLVEARDPASLASGLLRVLRDRSAARRMGRQHGRRCRELGDWEAIATKTAALYEPLVRAARVEEAPPRTASARPATSAQAAKARRLPFITVLMPVRDEEAAIDSALASLLAQDYPRTRYEILVMDGRSRDRTRERVRAIVPRDARVRLFDNPGRIVSTALNLGFGRARGTLVARADGHSRYASDYLRAAARAFDETGADVVGGPMVAEACHSPFERAVARALRSRFGMGGSSFHSETASGPADGVYLGAFRAEALRRFGPFNEHLVRNQDDEWFARARSLGARVVLDPRIRSTYQPRAGARRLFRQYFEYGLFKPAALKQVAGSFRWRHAVPSALLLALVLPPLVGLAPLAAAALLAYASALFVAATGATTGGGDGRESRIVTTARQAAVFALMHAGYGLGFLAGLLRRAPDETPAAIRRVYAGYATDARTQRRWSGRQRGQAAIVAERDLALARRLCAHFAGRNRAPRILDLGSGDRDLAGVLARLGVEGARVVAVDLLAERLAANSGRARIAADGRLLPFADRSFDAVVQCTMLTSLRALAARRMVAAEMVRVCRPGGIVLSYDARLPNPFNRNVRRLSRREHRELFDGAAVAFEPLTLLPPLARLAPSLAPAFTRVKALRAFDLAAIEPVPALEPP